MTYVKEVSNVINEGISDRQAMFLYDALTDRFEDICGAIETEDFQRNILAIRKHDRAFFRQVIDEVYGKYPFAVELNWRQVKYEPTRIGRCELCGSYFYDVSRNGRKLTCDRGGEYFWFDVTNREFRYFYKNGQRLSVCGALYEQRRRAGSVLYPTSKRNPNEVLTDFNPDENDAKGNAWLNEVETTVWNRR